MELERARVTGAHCWNAKQIVSPQIQQNTLYRVETKCILLNSWANTYQGPTLPEEFENATITGHFRFVVEGNSAKGLS